MASLLFGEHSETFIWLVRGARAGGTGNLRVGGLPSERECIARVHLSTTHNTHKSHFCFTYLVRDCALRSHKAQVPQHSLCCQAGRVDHRDIWWQIYHSLFTAPEKKSSSHVKSLYINPISQGSCLCLKALPKQSRIPKKKSENWDFWYSNKAEKQRWQRRLGRNKRRPNDYRARWISRKFLSFPSIRKPQTAGSAFLSAAPLSWGASSHQAGLSGTTQSASQCQSCSWGQREQSTPRQSPHSPHSSFLVCFRM